MSRNYISSLGVVISVGVAPAVCAAPYSYELPVHVGIYTDDDGSNAALTEEHLYQTFERMNAVQFQAHGIHAYVASVTYVANSTYNAAAFRSAELGPAKDLMSGILDGKHPENTRELNAFFNTGATMGGLAWGSRISISECQRTVSTTASTMSHEMGHNLRLSHLNVYDNNHPDGVDPVRGVVANPDNRQWGGTYYAVWQADIMRAQPGLIARSPEDIDIIGHNSQRQFNSQLGTQHLQLARPRFSLQNSSQGAYSALAEYAYTSGLAGFAAPDGRNQEMWGQLGYQQNEHDGDGALSGYETQSSSVAVGWDSRADENMWGTMLSIWQSELESDTTDDSYQQDGLHAYMGVYGRLGKKWYLSGQLGAGYGMMESDRRSQFLGAKADADFEALVGYGELNGGREYNLNKRQDIDLSVGCIAQWIQIDSYQEASSTAGYALEFDSQDQTNVYARAGVQWIIRWDDREAPRWQTTFGVDGRYALSSNEDNLVYRSAGSSGELEAAVLQSEDWLAVLRASSRWQITDGFDLSLELQYHLADKLNGYGAQLKGTWAF